MPALRLAPAGTPVTRIDSVSEPSVSASDDAIVSAIAVSSEPDAADTVRFGVSATGFTVIVRRPVAVSSTESVSLTYAVTPSVRSASLFDAGRSDSVAICAAVNCHDPPPRSEPCDSSVAEAGIPDTR